MTGKLTLSIFVCACWLPSPPECPHPDGKPPGSLADGMSEGPERYR
jgi:hypothetical protein